MAEFLVGYFSLVFLLTVDCFYCASWPNVYKIGIISAYIPEDSAIVTLQTAADKLVADGIVPQQLNFSYRYMFACSDNESLSAAIDLRYKYFVDAYHGPDCSPGAIAAGLFAAYENALMITDGTQSDVLSNKQKYKTFVRTSATSGPIGEAVANLLLHFNWTRVFIVKSRIVDCETSLSGTTTYLKLNNITIIDQIFADDVYEYKKAANIIRDTARIVILCFGFNPSLEQVLFMQTAYNESLVNPDYVFIAPWFGSTGSKLPFENTSIDQNSDPRTQYFKNTIFIRSEDVNNGEFLASIKQKLGRGLQMAEPLMLVQMFDAMYALGLSLNKTIENGENYKSGTANFNTLRLAQFEGTSGLWPDFDTVKIFLFIFGACGKITLNAAADKMPNYVIIGRILENDTFLPFMKSYITITNKTNYIFKYDKIANPNWNTLYNLPPKAVPICGFKNEFCPKMNNSNLIVAIALGVTIAVFICCLIYYLYRKKKREEQLIYLSWRINPDEIAEISRRNHQSSMATFSENVLTCMSSFDENRVLYKGETVFRKQWKKKNQVRLNREQFLLLKQLKELQHTHLNPFLGANFETGLDVIILWSYCNRGSLRDILYNDKIPLDMVFKTSLMKDVVSGLEFLHKSPIDHHGSLFINNCLVGPHWDVKLTNFGMFKILNILKANNVVESVDDYNNLEFRKKCHIAPEILQLTSPPSKTGDVYSLSMILYQILFRVELYSSLDMKQYEIIHAVIKKNLRPSLEFYPEKEYENLINIITECWHPDQKKRPYINEIKRNLSSATKKYGKNLTDHVLSVLETYANNLEKIVDERTQQLLEERRKADTLLYQMLPKSIADGLKRGECVMPETYDSVTVYFSDIVGFTCICSLSTTTEVVTFLNLLYSAMDNLISVFDVYKVETIGDSYLVVSGLPERNGVRHVTEISDLALATLKLLETFEIPHLQDVKLKFRIGIHTGPVASGVVGIKMPRYCLFGDTVNFASRMESSGQANKIQISHATRTLLLETNMYEIISRGAIEIKGKGLQSTYWLIKKL